MNFESAYLTALDGLIVAMGGTVPLLPSLNFRDAELGRLSAIVVAAGGALPGADINYQDATLRRWAAAIAGLGGAVPPPQNNYRLSLLLHVQALQAARGVSTAIAGRNFQEALLGLLGASGAPVFDAAAQAIITATETADGQALESTVRNAINDLVIGCKIDGTYPFLSAGVFRLLAGPRTLAGCFAAGVGASPTNFGFVSGDHSRSLGLKGGDDKYLNANRLLSDDAQNNRSCSVWISESQSSGVGVFMNGGASASTVTMGYDVGTAQAFLRYVAPNTQNVMVGASLTGHLSLRRNTSESYTARLNSTDSTFSFTSVTPTASDTFIFARFVPSVIYTDARLGFYHIGPDLDNSLLQGRVSTYMSAIAGI